MAQIKNARKANIFDTHHKIERFAIVFMTFVIALGLISAVCLKRKIDAGKFVLTEQALYTGEACMSLSHEPFVIQNVYTNNDSTKAFILMKLDTADVDVTSFNVNANTYEMYMTGSEGIKGAPTGAVYVYGTTGYVGLYFANSMGFNPQLYDILIRSNDNRASKYQGYGVWEEGMLDESDMWHNQMRLRVNFGAKGCTHAEFLEDDTLSVEKVYNELILSDSFKGTQKELDETLITMYSEMLTINEYSDLLRNEYGVRVPSLPNQIAGDYITNVAENTINNPLKFSTSMLSSNSVIVDNFGYTLDASAGSIEDLVANQKCYYVTDFVYPGGMQYDYQDLTTINHKYTDILGTRNAEETILLFDSLTTEAESYNSSVTFNADVYYKAWYFNDGTLVTVDNNNAKLVAINNAITGYKESVANLIVLKEYYQKTLLPTLIGSELQVESLSDVTTINSDALSLY